jgi:hypothetical protein
MLFAWIAVGDHGGEAGDELDRLPKNIADIEVLRVSSKL